MTVTAGPSELASWRVSEPRAQLVLRCKDVVPLEERRVYQEIMIADGQPSLMIHDPGVTTVALRAR